MNDFFEPPPAPVVPDPQRYRQPPWIGAPQGTLPGVVAMELVPVQTETVAVCVSRLAAYPTGFEFDVVTMTTPDQPELDPMLFHHQHFGRAAGDGIPLELLRLGIQFATARRRPTPAASTTTTTTGRRRPDRSCTPAEEAAAADTGASRNGSGRSLHPAP